MRKVIAAAAVLAAATACSNDDGSRGGSVDWSKYSPQVQKRIDDLAVAGDCVGLQNEFDTADENDDLTRQRTGEGNADLMGYIDERLRDAGCYD